MPFGLLSHSLRPLVTAFDDADQIVVHQEEPIDDFWVKETRGYDLSQYAEELPLCEDLEPGTVGNGESCWSTCQGQCPNDVLKPGLAFDFDEIRPGHPGCTSHFECVGNFDRVLCHGVRALEDHVPENFNAAARELEDQVPVTLAWIVSLQQAMNSKAPPKQRCGQDFL
eukprot:symbB.v1.2.040246.t1/scaffold7099.1/size13327/1